jgi:hypothetical protein
MQNGVGRRRPTSIPDDEDDEEKLSRSVENLLKRVYAYISWGIRYQVDSEREVDQTLNDLGFRIPDRATGHHLLDIVVPTVLLIAAIVTVFGVVNNVVCLEMGWWPPTPFARTRLIAIPFTRASAKL